MKLTKNSKAVESNKGEKNLVAKQNQKTTTKRRTVRKKQSNIYLKNRTPEEQDKFKRNILH